MRERVITHRPPQDRTRHVLQNEIRSCAAPFINCLIVITDHHQISMCPCEEFDEDLLPCIDILVFVDNEVTQMTKTLLTK
jgi:hypothetical protein